MQSMNGSKSGFTTDNQQIEATGMRTRGLYTMK